MARVLIVDDDASFRESLAETLSALGHQAVAARNGRQGLALADKGGVDAVFLDFRLPDVSGLDVLREMKRSAQHAVPVVMLTAYASADNTIEAMKLGAFDHLAKPAGRHAIEKALAEALRAAGTPAAASGATRPREFVSRSAAMREVVKLIGRAAASDATVLVTGETGTGKEEVARALHQHSARSGRPFVGVNCSAIPRDLLESELFGHVRGAFTGAVASRAGIFRQADGGTLLLDEIGDMSPGLQAKLLRALEERAILPVGAERAVDVDVRIVAATHRDLAEEVRASRFREDLFYRLNVLHIRISPLRERREDIVPLAEYFLALSSDPPKSLSEAARRKLEEHAWPGNVRELRNVIERATVLSRGGRIDVDDLGLTAPPPAAARGAETLPAALAQVEEAMIRKALAEAEGNRAEAARRLGIHRQLLYAKLRQYGIEL
jgi:two-component system NtrC family response regulator